MVRFSQELSTSAEGGTLRVGDGEGLGEVLVDPPSPPAPPPPLVVLGRVAEGGVFAVQGGGSEGETVVEPPPPRLPNPSPPV